MGLSTNRAAHVRLSALVIVCLICLLAAFQIITISGHVGRHVSVRKHGLWQRLEGFQEDLEEDADFIFPTGERAGCLLNELDLFGICLRKTSGGSTPILHGPVVQPKLGERALRTQGTQFTDKGQSTVTVQLSATRGACNERLASECIHKVLIRRDKQNGTLRWNKRLHHASNRRRAFAR